MDEASGEQMLRRRRVLWPVLGVVATLLLAAFLALWLMRERLAENYIESELAARGVRATYRIERIGFGSQVLENLVIGDPAHPDAIVRRVEVQIPLGWTGPRVGRITARGARLFGRVENGRLSLGDVDRLLPPPSGRPFALPDQEIDIDDAAIAIATPGGPIALALTGRGNLADGFRGTLAAETRRLRLGGCDLDGARGAFALRVAALRPYLDGQAAMRTLRCGALSVERPLLALDATFAPALDHWRGTSAMRLARLQSGRNSLANLQGRFSFDGDLNGTVGRADLAASAAGAGFRAARASFAGGYDVALSSGRLGLEGELAGDGVVASDQILGPLARGLRAASATPLGPIAAALESALLRAGRSGAALRAHLRLTQGTLAFSALDAESASGARLQAEGGEGVIVALGSGNVRLDGDFSLRSGDFPETRSALRQPRAGAPLTGTASVAPMRAGAATLALAPIRFSATPGGATRFQTVARLDGPFAGGGVRGLVLPLSGAFNGGALTINSTCVTAGFEALRAQNLIFGPTRLSLCPIGRAMVERADGAVRGGAELRAPRFAGRLGGSPITLSANRIGVDAGGIRAANLSVRLRSQTGVNRLEIAALDGRFAGNGLGGGFAGLSGDLANVPLLLDDGRGRWRFGGGRLVASGHVRVADRTAPARFEPLTSDDFRLTLIDNRIRASGGLSHPESGTRLAQVAIDHDLRAGAGNAVLDVPGLRFAGNFQPETITRLARGVVALVEGVLNGQGRVAWNTRGVTSSGRFSTENTNLAAPFGPVEGLSTTLEFTDLLNLASAPTQEARVRLIRAGIDIYDGVIRYQLRPNYRIALESAHWPFAGGALDLEPTTLDFSHETTKYLTFRVTALDGARFIEQMDFSNLAATGIFDGVVPMQFDQSGGRIVDGRLAARPEGGTLSYVGELSDRDLGAYGILAFNALKSLRYSRFDLNLNGALDGEFVTNIDLDGVARDPVLTTTPSGLGVAQLIAGRVFSQVARIPFEFNIRIQGQFRSLMATARSFNDPTPLIEANLPRLLEAESPPPAVQPQESEPVR